MANLCVECYKKYVKENADVEGLTLSKELELCDGCNQYRVTIKGIKSFSLWDELSKKRQALKKEI